MKKGHRKLCPGPPSGRLLVPSGLGASARQPGSARQNERLPRDIFQNLSHPGRRQRGPPHLPTAHTHRGPEACPGRDQGPAASPGPEPVLGAAPGTLPTSLSFLFRQDPLSLTTPSGGLTRGPSVVRDPVTQPPPQGSGRFQDTVWSHTARRGGAGVPPECRWPGPCVLAPYPLPGGSPPVAHPPGHSVSRRLLRSTGWAPRGAGCPKRTDLVPGCDSRGSRDPSTLSGPVSVGSPHPARSCTAGRACLSGALCPQQPCGCLAAWAGAGEGAQAWESRPHPTLRGDGLAAQLVLHRHLVARWPARTWPASPARGWSPGLTWPDYTPRRLPPQVPAGERHLRLEKESGSAEGAPRYPQGKTIKRT